MRHEPPTAGQGPPERERNSGFIPRSGKTFLLLNTTFPVVIIDMVAPHAARVERDDPDDLNSDPDPGPARPVCRHSDRPPHRVNGAALVALSRDPDDAAVELLAGRDARLWDARIQPLPRPHA